MSSECEGRLNAETSQTLTQRSTQRKPLCDTSPLDMSTSKTPYIFETPRKRIKLGIRQQITIIVCFAAVFSLAVLAIPTSVYFNHTMTSLQRSLLVVIARLKATQVLQALRVLANQVYWLRLVAVYSDVLTSVRNGDVTELLRDLAQIALDQSVSGIEFFSEARLYDINLNIVVSSYKIGGLPDNVTSLLYPFKSDLPSPARLFNSSYGAYFTGPVSAILTANILGMISMQETTFMGVTYPVVSNDTTNTDQQYLFGFMSVVVNASSVLSACVDNALIGFSKDYLFNVFSSLADGLALVFPTQEKFDSSMTQEIERHPTLLNGTGSIAKGSFIWSTDEQVAVGYAPVPNLGNLEWNLIVLQPWNKFANPSNLLRNICIAVVLGTCVVSCAVAFFLAIAFVKPITKLTVAADEITKNQNSTTSDIADETLSRFSSIAFPRRHNRTQTSLLSGPNAMESDTIERTLLNGTLVRVRSKSHSFGSYGSGPYSSGLHLPGKISPVSSFFKNELTELTDTFNMMMEELELQYKYLEERVRVRTKELEASKIEAESANEAKTVFIANISHELRTPLNGILGMTAIAMEENDQNRIQESLRLIYRSGELLLHILTELLTYSKNTLNRSKLEPTNFQILEVAHQIKSIFDKLAVDQGVNFNILIIPNSLREFILFGDANRIIQIVMNLVSNALKFTPIDGSVSVNFKLQGEYDEQASEEADHHFVASKLEKTELQSGPVDLSSDDSDATKNHRQVNNIEVVSSSLTGKEPFRGGSHSTLASYVGEKRDEVLPFEDSTIPSLSIEESGDGKADNRQSGASVNMVTPEPIHGLVFGSAPSRAKPVKEFEQRESDVPKTWVIVIEVIDTGSGIDLKLQKKVFEPFVQGDQTLSRSYGGTGLGLSICRQLAAMMKGTLTLESEVSLGSKFVFTVPLKQVGEFIIPPNEKEEFCNDEFNPQSRVSRKVAFGGILFLTPIRISDYLTEKEKPSDYFSAHTESGNKLPTSRSRPLLKVLGPENHEGNRQSLAGGGGLCGENDYCRPQAHRILVAEDNKVNQAVIKRMLTLQGWSNITMACDGEEAVNCHKASLLENEPFDVIFMDIQMPKVDGLAATRQIRSIDCDVLIVALTAFADEGNVKECINSGMTGFLSKPLKKSNLLKIVSELCPQLICEVNGDKPLKAH